MGDWHFSFKFQHSVFFGNFHFCLFVSQLHLNDLLTDLDLLLLPPALKVIRKAEFCAVAALLVKQPGLHIGLYVGLRARN